MLEPRWLAFAGVAVLLTLAPGPDSLLVVRTSLLHGRATALRTIGGITVGLTGWALAAAFGVAALVARVDVVFTTLRLAGAAYLLVTGVRALLDARRPGPTEEVAVVAPSPAEAFRRGLVTNLLNPKIGVFFAVVLPQFTVDERPLLPQLVGFALFQVVVGLTWLGALATAAHRLGDLLRRPAARRGLDVVSGVALVGFAVRLATASR